jgi:hypothetical protein
VNKTGRTGRAERDRQNRIGRTGQAALDRQNGTGITVRQNRKAEPNIHNWTVRTRWTELDKLPGCSAGSNPGGEQIFSFPANPQHLP